MRVGLWCGSVFLALGWILAGSGPAMGASSPLEEGWGRPSTSRLKLGNGPASYKFDIFNQPEVDDEDTVAASDDISAPQGSSGLPVVSVLRIPTHKPAVPPRTSHKQQAAPLVRLPENGQLIAGLVLNLTVQNDKSLSGPVHVQQNGMINLPMAGYVDVTGLTINQAQEAISAAYADGFFVKPDVILTLRDEP